MSDKVDWAKYDESLKLRGRGPGAFPSIMPTRGLAAPPAGGCGEVLLFPFDQIRAHFIR
jgi:hypothetical protein